MFDFFNSQSKKQNTLKSELLIIFVLSVLIGGGAFAPIYTHYNGQLMDYGDYFLQYVPFIKELKRMILSGSLSWSWNSFLGDNFIGAYSYYTVFNPFAWSVMLFPDKYILYGTMFTTLLKLGLCAVSAMLYISLFTTNKYALRIGALIYSFSGFTLVNTNFYFFIDVIAIYPFVVYGLERLIRDKKVHFYILFICINAFINYYFFVSSIILIIIYIFFRLQLFKLSVWKNVWRIVVRFILSSVVGIGLAGIALVPSFYAILGSCKAVENIGRNLSLFYWPQNILERLKILVAPIESGRYHAFFDSSTWSSTGFYLPVVGIYCVLLYCIRKNDWLKKMIIFLCICLFIPFLNSAFSLFSSTSYTRWLYGMVLLCSLASTIQLEMLEKNTRLYQKKIFFILTGCTAILLLVPTVVYFLQLYGISLVNSLCSVSVTDYFMGYPAIAIILIITFINYILLYKCLRGEQLKVLFRYVAIMCLINFLIYNMMNYDLHDTEYNNKYYYQKAMIEGEDSLQQEYEYRIDYPEQIVNYGLFKNMPSVNYYNSLQNRNSSKFADAVGMGKSIQDTILCPPQNTREYLDALLSVKYYVDYNGTSTIPFGFNFIDAVNGTFVYENSSYIPMGFTYESYSKIDELSDLSVEDKCKSLLSTLVIEEEDEYEIGQMLSKKDISNQFDFQREIGKRKASCCRLFVGTSNGFKAEIKLKEDNIVFFSVPYDSGWDVKVNGRTTKLYEVNYGLLGIMCNKGENIIDCTYTTPGLYEGGYCTVIFAILWLGMILVSFKQKITR